VTAFTGAHRPDFREFMLWGSGRSAPGLFRISFILLSLLLAAHQVESLGLFCGVRLEVRPDLGFS